MVFKRKNATTISLCLLSLLVLSVTPIYFGGALATQAPSVAAGDALKYKVTRFHFDMTEFNQMPDNPFEIQDPNFLAGSVLYAKILIAESHHLAYVPCFILGEDTKVDIDKSVPFPPEMDPDLFPDSIVLEGGAGIPLPVMVSYDPTHPFEPYLSPEELPLVIDPTVNWEAITDELINNYRPTNAEFVDGQYLNATWEQELPSDEEGFEKATITWDKNQGGIVIEADIEGQQEINGDMSPISMKITFWEKEEYPLPEEAGIFFEERYILREVNVYLDGYEDIPALSEEEKQGIANQIAMINELEGTTAFEIMVTDMVGLSYTYDLALLPDTPMATFESGMGVAFGLSIPFLTPDWDLYTSIWGTGNLAIDVVSAMISAIAPLPDIEISTLLLGLLTSSEQGHRYFGFTMGEEVSGSDPESGITFHTESSGDGWVAYEEDGLFAGLSFTVDGRFWTEDVPAEQGGDWDISFGGMAKIEREGIEVPQPTELAEPQLSPPDVETEEPPGPGFIPGFDLIAAVAALLGLSVIVVRKKRRT